LGPIISGSTHTPNVPDFGQDIVVTTTVREGTGTLNYVQLKYRVNYGGHTTVIMFDDGTTGGDAVAGDGIFTATIPAAGGAAAGEMVRWYIEAYDTAGHQSRWPLFQVQGPANQPQSEEYLGTAVADPAVTSQLRIYQLFVQDTYNMDKRAGTRGSVFYDGEFYDNVYIRERGNSSSYLPKTNHRIDFNRDHPFGADDSGYRYEEINLQANMADPAFLRETLEAETFARAGVPTIHAEQVRLELNGSFFQLAGLNESVDGDFLEHIGLDGDGALYKNPIMLNKYATSGRGPWWHAEKITRNNIDGPRNTGLPDYGMADLQDLVNGIYEGNSDAARATYILDNVDIPAAINYMASFHVTQEADSMHINVMVYRDTNDTGEWTWLPFDMNFSFGAWFSADFISGNRDNHFGHPFYGAEGFEPDVRNYSFSRLQDAIISTPETREMYLRRLRTLMDEFLQAPGTPAGELYFEGRLAEYQAAMQQDADLDRLINGHAYDFDVPWDWNNLPPMSFSDGIQQLISDYLEQRRTHLYVTHSVDNPSYDPNAPISKNLPAGIPHAQAGNPTINFGAFEYSPASGNQDEEYIELHNPNGVAVDISGWRLTDGVEFTFAPGTVIPSEGTLFVSPNVNAFRARATGPSGGQRRFVQGGYRGHLSSFGETVTLLAGDDQVVDTLVYEGNPTELQQYLRVTEVNYHPHPADTSRGELDVDENEFEFVELINTSIGQTLDLTGVRFTQGVVFDFTGSSVTSLAPGQRAVVVKNQAAFESRYDAGINIAGQFDAGISLSNGGGAVKLEDPTNGTILEFTYNDSEPWPVRADGDGSSLEVIDTGGDYGDPENWRPSSKCGGSPDEVGLAPVYDMMINEVLTHTDAPMVDSIELLNSTGAGIDLDGWYLSNSSGNFLQYRITDVSIPGGGYHVFDETDFNPNGEWNPAPDTPGPNEFALDGAHGDKLWLVQVNGAGDIFFADYVGFGGALNGESLGRWSNGAGDLYPTNYLTPGAANSDPRVGPLVISEVHYNSGESGGVDDQEFIEIHNPTDSEVDLTNWRISEQVDYAFEPGLTLDAHGTMVVLSFDPDKEDNVTRAVDFRAFHGIDGSVALAGGYSGKLDNSGGRVRLLHPDLPPAEEPTFVPHYIEDEVVYDDELPWPAGADGGGQSLNRYNPSLWGDDTVSWGAAAPSPGMVSFEAVVAGRHVFYNNSQWDGNDPLSGDGDDDAIAANKSVLLPGGTGAPANYTSYSRGINGIMVDIADPTAAPTDGDFGIRVNQATDPDTWSAGATPTVSVRAGDGVGGSDRVTLIWSDGAILNQWVEVTVLATANTGLADDDVFYFGSAVGDCDGDGQIGSNDYGMFVGQFGQRGGIAALAADLNGDGRVDLTDLANLRGAGGNSVLAPTLPAAAPEPPAATAAPMAPAVSQPPGDNNANDDSIAIPAPAPPVDLLANSLLAGGYISGPQPISICLPTTMLHRAATAEYDLRALGDDLLTDSPGDPANDGLQISIGMDDSLDILAESPVAIPI
jgi:spore coat protein CotH